VAAKAELSTVGMHRCCELQHHQCKQCYMLRAHTRSHRCSSLCQPNCRPWLLEHAPSPPPGLWCPPAGCTARCTPPKTREGPGSSAAATVGE
jgi:hypothetical protein